MFASIFRWILNTALMFSYAVRSGLNTLMRLAKAVLFAKYEKQQHLLLRGANLTASLGCRQPQVLLLSEQLWRLGKTRQSYFCSWFLAEYINECVLYKTLNVMQMLLLPVGTGIDLKGQYSSCQLIRLTGPWLCWGAYIYELWFKFAVLIYFKSFSPRIWETSRNHILLSIKTPRIRSCCWQTPRNQIQLLVSRPHGIRSCCRVADPAESDPSAG